MYNGRSRLDILLVMVISLLHLGKILLCRVDSTVLAPPSLPYQISAVPVNNIQSMSKHWV